MDYILTVQSPAYSITSDLFAVESAFGQHLRDLKITMGDAYSQIILLAPQLPTEEYEQQKHQLTVLSLSNDGIRFIALFDTTLTATKFWVFKAFTVFRKSRMLLRSAAVLHSGMSFSLRQPALAIINLAAWIENCPTIFIVDIDFRSDPDRYVLLGKWSKPKYWINQALLMPFRKGQIWLSVRMFQLVLLKGESLVDDFGRNRSNVKNFYDTVHSTHQLLSAGDLIKKREFILDMSLPLTVCYFGRLVWKKGVDRMISAVAHANRLGRLVILHIIGDGQEKENLKKLVNREGLASVVRFFDPVIYGDPLFDCLERVHLVLAAPLIEDTPRATFDALARGIPVLAFDTAYFRGLAAESISIQITPWADPNLMGEQIASLDRNRERLASMAIAGVEFARKNTQEIWLGRRAKWTSCIVR